jgi:hypothetical protein
MVLSYIGEKMGGQKRSRALRDGAHCAHGHGKGSRENPHQLNTYPPTMCPFNVLPGVLMFLWVVYFSELDDYIIQVIGTFSIRCGYTE